MTVQERYRKAMISLGPEGRLMRVCSLYRTGYAMLEMRVKTASPELSGRALQLAVARKMYRKDPQVQKLLDVADRELATNGQP